MSIEVNSNRFFFRFNGTITEVIWNTDHVRKSGFHVRSGRMFNANNYSLYKRSGIGAKLKYKSSSKRKIVENRFSWNN